MYGKYVCKFYVCEVSEGQTQNTRLYTHMPTLRNIWEGFSMDFGLVMPRTE